MREELPSFLNHLIGQIYSALPESGELPLSIYIGIREIYAQPRLSDLPNEFAIFKQDRQILRRAFISPRLLQGVLLTILVGADMVFENRLGFIENDDLRLVFDISGIDVKTLMERLTRKDYEDK